MAVVLPIHSRIDFSNPMENNYESHCQSQNEEKAGKETDSRLYTNESENKRISDNGYRPRCLSNVKEEKVVVDGDYESADSMDTSDSSDGCNKKPNNTLTLPLNLSGQIDTSSINSNNSTINDDCNQRSQKDEELVESNSVDNNYWLVDNENRDENENIHESDNAEDENSTFISSLMAVDLASTNNNNNNTSNEPGDHQSIEPPNLSSISNIVEAILMDEINHQKEDDMKLEFDETPKIEALTTSTSIFEEANAIPEIDFIPEPSLYGGLENLGNTCYMASAIQLLCGLDSFPAELKSRIPPENRDDDNKNGNKSKSSQSLRDALIDVMNRLGNGERVRPDDLKSSIDSRTGLFLGYRQQDSHEFLTTLLDIIDEDYKIKPIPDETTAESDDNSSNDGENDYSGNEEESRECNEIIGNNSDRELTDDTNNIEQLPSSHEDETNKQECNDEEIGCNGDADENDQKSLEHSPKKQKVVKDIVLVKSELDSTAFDAIESGGEPRKNGSIQRSKSYSNFKFRDIESLLHDKDDSSKAVSIAARTETSSSSVPAKTAARQDEPKCKLAGGRMSTAGVELTRFGDGSGFDEDVRPTDASLGKATPQQHIVEGEHHDDTNEEGESEESYSSPVSSNFTTKVRVCLTCESCKFRRSHIETYLHISLDIGTGSNDDANDDDISNLGCPASSSIEEGLRRFFAPEKRDIKCEKCFHTSAIQTSEITQLPRNLLFHLKRFIVDVSPDYSSISYRKDQSSVIFDERMELEANDDEIETNHALRNVHDDEERGFKDFLSLDCSYEKGAAYEIRSVVNHIGSSASCGHYTADAKRQIFSTGKPETETESQTIEREEHTSEEEDSRNESSSAVDEEEKSDDRQWIRFNDSYVSKISSNEAVQDASQTAYMIMYELVH